MSCRLSVWIEDLSRCGFSTRKLMAIPSCAHMIRNGCLDQDKSEQKAERKGCNAIHD
jgi:hypothetical protein